MKVTIVTLYKGSFPFVNELMDNLTSVGVDNEVFDMFEMCTVKFENQQQVKSYHTENAGLRKFFNKGIPGKISKLLFYKFYLLFKPVKADHISVQYVLPFYSFFIKSFKKSSTSLSAFVWGSDFYRISNEKRNSLSSLFEECDSILMGNSKMAEEFSAYYDQKFSEKIKEANFGIAKLDSIKNLVDVSGKALSKKELHLPDGKKIITIGYNGLEAQQHLLILNQIENLSQKYRADLFLVIPFGYGGNLEYKNELKRKLDSMNIEYRIFDSFLSDMEVTYLRIATDLAINAQVSDAASASIQEHLCAKNVVLTGDWLPYDFFLEKGIKFWSFNESDFLNKLSDILDNFEFYATQVKDNHEKIFQLSSWNARLGGLVKIFENRL